ncbi:unnamed protein product [Mucor circinelloides]
MEREHNNLPSSPEVDTAHIGTKDNDGRKYLDSVVDKLLDTLDGNVLAKLKVDVKELEQTLIACEEQPQSAFHHVDETILAGLIDGCNELYKATRADDKNESSASMWNGFAVAAQNKGKLPQDRVKSAKKQSVDQFRAKLNINEQAYYMLNRMLT